MGFFGIFRKRRKKEDLEETKVEIGFNDIEEYLEKQGSEKAHKLLHTKYTKRGL